jgi:hypothetical protein
LTAQKNKWAPKYYIGAKITIGTKKSKWTPVLRPICFFGKTIIWQCYAPHYYIGDFLSKFDLMWWFYNKFMIWSCDLDVNKKIWKENKEEKN